MTKDIRFYFNVVNQNVLRKVKGCGKRGIRGKSESCGSIEINVCKSDKSIIMLGLLWGIKTIKDFKLEQQQKKAGTV